jgi:pyruvate/2-oxoglutarate/acetoin dehydrogenase E1 component
MFLGVPGLRVLAPNTLGDPSALLEAAIVDDDPVLFVEHKLLYTRPMLEAGIGDLADFSIESRGVPFATSVLRLTFPHTPHLTIATYGYNFELVRRAALELLMEREIFCELILFSQLSPFEISPLLASLQRTRRLLTVEEGGLTLGWGTEITARVTESGLDPAPSIRRVAALDLPIANSKPLEDAILPSKDAIVHVAMELVE